MQKDLHPIFEQMASYDQECMDRYMKVCALRAAREDFKTPLQQTDPYNFYDVAAKGYALMDDPDDGDVREMLFNLKAGKLLLTPGYKKLVLQTISDILLVQEGNLFAGAVKESHERKSKVCGAKPA
jgi:hypothetical protein